MSYYDGINLGDIWRECNRKPSKTWTEIKQLCIRRGLNQQQLTKKAINGLSQKYRKALESPDTPEGIKALMMLQQVMLELAKGWP